MSGTPEPGVANRVSLGLMWNAVITPAIETLTLPEYSDPDLRKKTRVCLCGAGGRDTETAGGGTRYPRIDYARRAPGK